MKLTKSKDGSFLRSLSRYTGKLEKASLNQAKKIMQDALWFAAAHSPQHSGTFASNWRLGINKPRVGDTKSNALAQHGERYTYHLAGDRWETGKSTYKRKKEGDPEAITKATGSLGSKLTTLKMGDRIYLSTIAINSDTGENYTWEVEDGKIKFREANPSARAWKGKISKKTSSYIRNKYSKALK